mmetsp:Transcript_13884/g.44479  ORF Transcript_13884/g.44479 Transcript_13884/m.44479 type:complete len:215 (-) Transcript_13884:257-901(-)
MQPGSCAQPSARSLVRLAPTTAASLAASGSAMRTAIYPATEPMPHAAALATRPQYRRRPLCVGAVLTATATTSIWAACLLPSRKQSPCIAIRHLGMPLVGERTACFKRMKSLCARAATRPSRCTHLSATPCQQVAAPASQSRWPRPVGLCRCCWTVGRMEVASMMAMASWQMCLLPLWTKHRLLLLPLLLRLPPAPPSVVAPQTLPSLRARPVA